MKYKLIEGERTYSTTSYELWAFVKSGVPDIPYRTVRQSFGATVEVKFVFSRTAEVERLIKEFCGDEKIQRFVETLRLVKDEIMQNVKIQKSQILTPLFRNDKPNWRTT